MLYTAIKHHVPNPWAKPSFVIFDARMSKIINDDLTRSGIGCFIVYRTVTALYPYDNGGRQRINNNT